MSEGRWDGNVYVIDTLESHCTGIDLMRAMEANAETPPDGDPFPWAVAILAAGLVAVLIAGVSLTVWSLT